MVPVLTVAVAIIGAVAAVAVGRLAWRAPTRDRLRHVRPRARRLLPEAARTPLARALHDAHLAMTPEDAVATWLTAIATAGLLASVLHIGLAPIAIAIVAAGGPIGLGMARGRGLRQLVAALPGFVELVCARLRSGHTVHTALADAANRDDPVAGDVRRVLARVALGEPLTGALAWWAADRRLDPIRAAAGALAVASDTGGAAGDALEGLARSLRGHLGARADADSLSAQARLSAVVVGTAPVAYVAFAASVDPRAARVLVSSSTGRVCLVLGLALDALGAWWMRRIVRSEP
jgi:tight adherence protein B